MGLRVRWRADPVGFVRETYEKDPAGRPIVIDPAQVEILEAVRDHDRVVVRTGRGVGKTAGAAGMIVPWFLSCFYPVRVVTAAGTWNHLTEKLWPEIRMWGACWLLRETWDYQELGIYHKLNPDGWRVVAETSNDPEKVEGHHSPNLLILVDEAKAMPDPIFTALLASLTDGTGVQKVVALSTPPLSGSGWFAEACKSSAWHLVHVDGRNSARVSRAFIEEIRSTYGEESPEFQAYVAGQTPDNPGDTVVPASWFEAAQACQAHDRRPAVITCDVAREGEDLTTIGKIEDSGFDLVHFPEAGRYGWFAHQDIETTAERCLDAVKAHKAEALCIDDGGVGGGVTDILRNKQARGEFPASCSIIPLNFGESARRKPERYEKLKDELWWETREAIRQKRLRMPSDQHILAWRTPRGSDFKRQVTSALYEYRVDQLYVLDKRKAGKEKTASLPTKSPDLAHALILGVQRYFSLEAPPPPEEPKTPEQALWAVVQQNVQRAIRPPVRDPYRRQG